MSKKLFIILILLMSLSLIGIIFVQAYYINNSVQNEERQFNFNVKNALVDVSKTIEEREIEAYWFEYQRMLDNMEMADSTAITNLLAIHQNKSTNETFVYRSGILEENYKLSSSLFDIGLDSINVTRITGNSETQIFSDDNLSELDLRNKKSRFSILESGRLTEAERIGFNKLFKKKFIIWI